MKKNINLNDVTILDLLYVLTKKYGGRPALQIKEKDAVRCISYDELRERSVGVSSFLIDKGVEPDAHVAIISENRPEWAIAFFGIISAACVTIPVDAKLSITEMLFILNDSKSQCLFISKKFLAEILAHRNELPYLQKIICLDNIRQDGIITLEDLAYNEDKTPNRPEAVKPEHTVLIVYTSGTTGVAKGVELSYRNLLFEVMRLYELIRFSPQDSFVSILPLNHMLEITGGLIAPLYGGSTVTYCPSLKPAQIIAVMRETKATGMVCVPLVLKMFYNGIIKEVQKLRHWQQRLFWFCERLSRLLLSVRVRAGSLFFRSVHRKFGKKFKYFVSGGAPLDVSLEKNFDALGFTILQGYGLTETSPVVSVNTPKKRKYGSVGQPLDGVAIEIRKAHPDSVEGEIFVKGPNVMKGYYNNPQKTQEVLQDGWFSTGDLGYLDKDSFLFISGRAKNLIVLGGGKKIFPEEVEQVMSESPYIKEICVLGKQATEGLKQGTEEVFAVIVPDLDRFDAADKNDQEKIRATISRELAEYSRHLADYKKISDFQLHFDELPKTSTRKIKRNAVREMVLGVYCLIVAGLGSF